MLIRRGRSVSSGLAMGIAMGIGWCAVGRGEPALAAPPRGEPPLEWRAPEGCPAREAVLEQVAVLAARQGVRWSRFSQIRGSVEPAGGFWRLTLEFVGGDGVGRRTFESGRCGELAEAAAVAIVLAHREGTSAAKPAPTDDDAATPGARSGNARGGAGAAASGPGTRGGQARRAARSSAPAAPGGGNARAATGGRCRRSRGGGVAR